MAGRTIDVVMDDGTIVEGVPEGTTKAQLQAKLNAKPKAAPGSEPLDFEKMARGNLQNIVRGFGYGGPFGMATAAGQEWLKNAGQMVERGGYHVGGLAADKFGPEAGVLANAAVNAIPMVIGGGTGKVIEKGSQALARQLMLDAINPSANARLTGEGQRAAQTFLERGASPTQGGIAQLKALFPDLMGQRSRAIEAATETIPKGEIPAAAQDVIGRLEKRNPFAHGEGGPIAEVEALINKWLTNPNIPQNMTAREAQLFKEGLQDLLKNKFNRPTTEAEVLGQKAMEEALRTAIERVAPGTKSPNAEMSALINAINQAAPRATRGGGPTMFGIAPVAGSLEMQAIMAADRNPWIRSLLARALYQGGKSNVPTAIGVGAGGVYSDADPRIP